MKNRKNQDSAMHETLYVVKGEGILRLKTKRDLKDCHITYSVPVQYGEQVPLLLKIEKDTSSNVVYSIVDDRNEPNKLIKFDIKNFKREDILSIHFSYWVLIKNRRYRDFPKNATIPKPAEIPRDFKKWLQSTEAIQSDNSLIVYRAKLLKKFDNNLLNYARRVVYYICYHRPILSKLRSILEHKILLRDIFLPNRYWTGLMDAVSCLLFGGMCVAKANLGVALLRAVGIPARVLIVNPLFHYILEKIQWIDAMHYIIEFYVPNYGWVRANPGRAPYQTKNDIVLRIGYPEDENEAGNGLSYYGGMLPWFWFSDDNIQLDFPGDIYTYYKRPKSSGIPIASRAILKKIELSKELSESIFDLAVDVWNSYLNLFRKKNLYLNYKNQDRIIKFQKRALNSIINLNIFEYIQNMEKALKIFGKDKQLLNKTIVYNL